MPTNQEMAKERGGKKFRKESKNKRKKSIALEKNDLQWLSQNTHFESQNIKDWHQVGCKK